ncbi:hypothetical protein DOT_2265 [Desulfosporosinus sp. OT]|nr:hypothetical protein DOT_2265 [Desulfosporosinus sp. OT]
MLTWIGYYPIINKYQNLAPYHNSILVWTMMGKSTKRNCNKRKWDSGSHLQGTFGSASLS